MKVSDILLEGKENAIPSETLVSLLGVNSKRNLQKMIERERRAGAPILSSEKGGYYLPSEDWEVREFCRTLRNRAEGTMEALRNVEKAYKGRWDD